MIKKGVKASDGKSNIYYQLRVLFDHTPVLFDQESNHYEKEILLLKGNFLSLYLKS
jgi:hypothetical protein